MGINTAAIKLFHPSKQNKSCYDRVPTCPHQLQPLPGRGDLEETAAKLPEVCGVAESSLHFTCSTSVFQGILIWPQ